MRREQRCACIFTAEIDVHDGLLADVKCKGGVQTQNAAVAEFNRAKQGIFEGDIYQGELEIGQIASQIKRLQPVAEVMQELVDDYHTALRRIQDETGL